MKKGKKDGGDNGDAEVEPHAKENYIPPPPSRVLPRRHFGILGSRGGGCMF